MPQDLINPTHSQGLVSTGSDPDKDIPTGAWNHTKALPSPPSIDCCSPAASERCCPQLDLWELKFPSNQIIMPVTVFAIIIINLLTHEMQMIKTFIFSRALCNSPSDTSSGWSVTILGPGSAPCTCTCRPPVWWKCPCPPFYLFFSSGEREGGEGAQI